jgi:hypothetical protein
MYTDGFFSGGIVRHADCEAEDESARSTLLQVTSATGTETRPPAQTLLLWL